MHVYVQVCCVSTGLRNPSSHHTGNLEPFLSMGLKIESFLPTCKELERASRQAGRQTDRQTNREADRYSVPPTTTDSIQLLSDSAAQWPTHWLPRPGQRFLRTLSDGRPPERREEDDDPPLGEEVLHCPMGYVDDDYGNIVTGLEGEGRGRGRGRREEEGRGEGGRDGGKEGRRKGGREGGKEGRGKRGREDMNDQSLRQGKAKQLHVCLKTTPFFSRELPQAELEPTTFCIPGRCSTN